MPLVAISPWPAYARLRAEGEDVLDPERACRQDIRELHIGLFNLMPDAAFEATERQFLRLVGGCNRIVQFFVHPFTAHAIPRSDALRAHIDAHYERFDDIRAHGLDALIITGANVPDGPFEATPFWPELTAVLDYARAQITSTLCACLATHAALHHFHGLDRLRLPRKCWGVYPHRHDGARHPLVRGTNTRFDVPHSRHNDIAQSAMEAAGLRVLAASADAGVHLAVSPDLIRFVYFQGHPEYDRESLLKEYRREVTRYLHGERAEYPAPPDGYLSPAGRRLARAFEAEVGAARAPAAALAARFPEAELLAEVDNTWGDTARVVFNNWLGTVYQITGLGRGEPLMPDLDHADPLGLRVAPSEVAP